MFDIIGKLLLRSNIIWIKFYKGYILWFLYMNDILLKYKKFSLVIDYFK